MSSFSAIHIFRNYALNYVSKKMILIVMQPIVFNGVPNEIRTRVTAVKGRCPRPLDDGDSSIS